MQAVAVKELYRDEHTKCLYFDNLRKIGHGTSSALEAENEEVAMAINQSAG